MDVRRSYFRKLVVLVDFELSIAVDLEAFTVLLADPIDTPAVDHALAVLTEVLVSTFFKAVRTTTQ